MARRKQNGSPLDVFFEILLLFPWWVTLILGSGLWVYLKWQPSPTGFTLEKPVMIWYGLQFLKWSCFLAAFISGIKTLSRKSLFASAKGIEAIRAMSWREFETLVGEAYRRQGYAVEETGGGGADGGIDLILRGKGQKVLVQCKQWKTVKVGVKIVREMYGVKVAERSDRVILVSSGAYTPDAVAFARGKPIELVDGKALVALIREVKGASQAVAVVPSCPVCGAEMVLRRAKRGANAGDAFWGCPRYPACRGVVEVR